MTRVGALPARGVGLGTASDGVGFTFRNCCNYRVAAGFRGNSKRIVALVAVTTCHGCAINSDCVGAFDPQRKLAGDSACALTARYRAVIAAPSDEHRIAGGNADRVWQMIVEIVGIAFTELVDYILVRIRRRQCCTLSHRGRVGVGRILANEYDTTGWVRNILAKFRDNKVAVLIGRCGERRSQYCAVCRYLPGRSDNSHRPFRACLCLLRS